MFVDFLPENLAKSPSAALAVLTSMITPALLLSACGAFILSTSNRLGRVIDRTRRLSETMEDIMRDEYHVELLEERRDLIFTLIDRQSRRASYLARTLVIFYSAAAAFVATSVAIGFVSLYGPRQAWVALITGIAGACLMFVGSVLLILEARLTMSTLGAEIGFLKRLVDHHYGRRAGTI